MRRRHSPLQLPQCFVGLLQCLRDLLRIAGLTERVCGIGGGLPGGLLFRSGRGQIEFRDFPGNFLLGSGLLLQLFLLLRREGTVLRLLQCLLGLLFQSGLLLRETADRLFRNGLSGEFLLQPGECLFCLLLGRGGILHTAVLQIEQGCRRLA